MKVNVTNSSGLQMLIVVIVGIELNCWLWHWCNGGNGGSGWVMIEVATILVAIMLG